MKPLKAELITESLYEIKTLFSLYRGYAQSFPQNAPETKTTQKEMKVVKQQILKHLVDLKKLVKKMESEVALRV
ncbi:hypothetical protein J4470_04710 [Candidatus Woesearchaeota archaeon]|nr:hypothetical protein [Candidatus Woesearchaeota archaeon]